MRRDALSLCVFFSLLDREKEPLRRPGDARGGSRGREQERRAAAGDARGDREEARGAHGSMPRRRRRAGRASRADYPQRTHAAPTFLRKKRFPKRGFLIGLGSAERRCRALSCTTRFGSCASCRVLVRTRFGGDPLGPVGRAHCRRARRRLPRISGRVRARARVLTSFGDLEFPVFVCFESFVVEGGVKVS